ncbi:hypothetical protein M231_07791, partial [Tremella mesenterica]
ATSSYINPKTVEELGLEVIRYPEEVPVRMFDGSESIGGPITKFVETGIRVSIEDEVRMIRLDVTKLCNAEVVIGWEWMKKEGVILDVRKEVIKIPGTQKREEEKLGAVFGFKEGETLGPRDSALEDELSEEEQEELLELVPSEYHGVVDPTIPYILISTELLDSLPDTPTPVSCLPIIVYTSAYTHLPQLRLLYL